MGGDFRAVCVIRTTDIYRHSPTMGHFFAGYFLFNPYYEFTLYPDKLIDQQFQKH